PDLINNKYQLHLAMEAARRVIPEIMEEYARVSGRRYTSLDLYRMDDAEVALFLMNSAAETAKDVVDSLRRQGLRVGVMSPNVLRPFPSAEIAAAARGLKALVIGERAGSFGSDGGAIAHEIKSALQEDRNADTVCITRVYGLGGKDFYPADAESFFRLGFEAAREGRVAVPFDFHGVTPGDPARKGPRGLAPISREEATDDLVRAIRDETTGRLTVKAAPLRELTRRPKRIAPGHGACPGCGIFPALNLFFAGLTGDVVVLYQTGCAMVVTTGYPFSAHRVTYVHNLFQNGSATLSG